jgi:hypothetical protein
MARIDELRNSLNDNPVWSGDGDRIAYYLPLSI